MNQSGQALLIILLATLVALSIALSLTQRSQSDLASSNRGDQASRALAAAEAGIETGLSSTSPINQDNYLGSAVFQNQSSVSLKSTGLVPTAADQSIEYPAVDKTAFAQYWLSGYPANTSFTVYFADPTKYPSNCASSTCPAIAVTLIVNNAGAYQFVNQQFDSNSTRAFTNNFTRANCNLSTSLNNVFSLSSANFNQPSTANYYCSAQINYSGTPILVRIRPLYTDIPLKTAIAPLSGLTLPAQAVYYSAIGTAGQSKRNVRLFTQKDVVPFFFDYAIFSSGTINK